MINKDGKNIISKLLKKYDRSILSIGENKKKISIYLDVDDKSFPNYVHPKSLESADNFEKDCKSLTKLGIVTLNYSDGMISKIYLVLNEDLVKKARELLGESDPKKEAGAYIKLFSTYKNDEDEVVNKFANSMLTKLKDYRKLDSIKKYFIDEKTLVDIIKGIKAINNLEGEIRERNLSINLYSDSKRLIYLSNKINRIYREFSNIEFDENSNPIETLGVVHNPSFALVKNGIVIEIDDQIIDLTKLNSPFPLYDEVIKNLKIINVNAKKVITIENLTTFYDYDEKESVIIYLGGFHNKIRKVLIEKIYRFNCSLKFYHRGDIDAGGFYIFNHLKQDTKIDFNPMNMGVLELKKYSDFCKKLTESDIRRLNIQKNDTSFSVFKESIEYMLVNDVKLEQEAFSGK